MDTGGAEDEQIFVTLPLDNIGDVESRIFAQIRVGQGSGLNAMPSYSKPNASAFRVLGTDPDNSVAVLGQAWYQATIPLPFGGYKPRSREKLEVNFGKMDPFVFFDQNAAANDETKQFLNTVFVHNPLLDAGGEVGVDANGFQPGEVDHGVDSVIVQDLGHQRFVTDIAFNKRWMFAA